jgi:hypothetical protein
MCRDTVGPFESNDRLFDDMRQLLYIKEHRDGVALSVIGLVLPRFAGESEGFTFPRLVIKSAESGLMQLSVTTSGHRRVLMRRWLWNSTARSNQAVALLNPGRQVGLSWPGRNGWNVWLWNIEQEER